MHFMRPGEQAENCLPATVIGRTFIGEIWEYRVRVDLGQEVKVRLSNAPGEYLPLQKEVVQVGWSIENTLPVKSSAERTEKE
jgi:hypothetical protein